MRISVQASPSSFDRLAEEVWSMMNQLACGNYFRSSAPPAWSPRLNVYEASSEIIVCVDLAGMKREDIDVTIEGRNLVITGVRTKPCVPGTPREVSVLLMEIDSGRFHRTVGIPNEVETHGIAAQYRDGYLFVILPLRRREVHGGGPA
jgi:HSP20 family molecular chaperone IbpA